MLLNDIKVIHDLHSRGETRAGRTRPAPRRRVWSELAIAHYNPHGNSVSQCSQDALG